MPATTTYETPDDVSALPAKLKSTGVDTETPITREGILFVRSLRKAIEFQQRDNGGTSKADVLAAIDSAAAYHFGAEVADWLRVADRDAEEANDPGFTAGQGGADDDGVTTATAGYSAMSLLPPHLRPDNLRRDLQSLRDAGKITRQEFDLIAGRIGVQKMSLDAAGSVRCFLDGKQGATPGQHADGDAEAEAAASWAMRRKR